MRIKSLQQTNRLEFTEREHQYLSEQKLARVATVSEDQQPHVVPVTYGFDGSYFYFSGWNLQRSVKFRNIEENNKVAIVVDDLAQVSPWTPRGIAIRGIAKILEKDGHPYVRITPLKKVSWGVEEE